jgi:hypothetical protein
MSFPTRSQRLRDRHGAEVLGRGHAAGLVQALSREELQGVVSHELSHVRNYDIRVMTVVAALVGSVLLLSDWGRRGLWWGGGRRRSSDEGGGGSGPFAILFFAVWVVSLLLAPLIAQLVAMAVSLSASTGHASGASPPQPSSASALENQAAPRPRRSSRASPTSASRIRAAR